MPQDEMTLQAAEKPQSVGSTAFGFFGGSPGPNVGWGTTPFPLELRHALFVVAFGAT